MMVWNRDGPFGLRVAVADNYGSWEIRDGILANHFEVVDCKMRPFRYDGLFMSESKTGKEKRR